MLNNRVEHSSAVSAIIRLVILSLTTLAFILQDVKWVTIVYDMEKIYLWFQTVEFCLCAVPISSSFLGHRSVLSLSKYMQVHHKILEYHEVIFLRFFSLQKANLLHSIDSLLTK